MGIILALWWAGPHVKGYLERCMGSSAFQQPVHDGQAVCPPSQSLLPEASSVHGDLDGASISPNNQDGSLPGGSSMRLHVPLVCLTPVSMTLG